MKIHKYLLKNRELEQTVILPAGAKPMSIQYQAGQLYLWAMVDSSEHNSREPYTIYCVGTGQDIPENAGCYICTVQESIFIWHFFYSLN